MLECLGGVYYSGNRHYKAFLLNSCGKEIKECKEIYIMGSGQESFMAYNLLKDRVKVLGMIDNNDKLAGKPAVCGGVYRSIKEVYGDDVCIVIATRRKYLNNNRWQMLVHNVEKYSLFFVVECADLNITDIKLAEAINSCVFNTGLETDLPPVNNVHISARFFLNPIEYLINSTTFWEPVFDYISRFKFKSCLEIGPGRGLLSYVIRESSGCINKLDWIVYEKHERDTLENQEWYNCYNKINKTSTDINVIKGIVEKPSFDIKGKYDLIIMTEVLEHFTTRPDAVIRKMRTWLNKDGVICISTPDYEPLHIYETYTEMPEYVETEGNTEEYFYTGHTYQYRKGELDTIFRGAGLEIVIYQLSASGHHNYVLKQKDDMK